MCIEDQLKKNGFVSTQGLTDWQEQQLQASVRKGEAMRLKKMAYTLIQICNTLPVQWWIFPPDFSYNGISLLVPFWSGMVGFIISLLRFPNATVAPPLPEGDTVPQRSTEGRVLCQRVPDPLQPDEGLPAHQQDPHPHRQKGGRCGRRQRGHGCCPQRPASIRCWTVYIVYPPQAALHRYLAVQARPRKGAVVFQDPVQTPWRSHANDEGFVKSITCIEMELGEPRCFRPRTPTRRRAAN